MRRETSGDWVKPPAAPATHTKILWAGGESICPTRGTPEGSAGRTHMDTSFTSTMESRVGKNRDTSLTKIAARGVAKKQASV